MTHYKNDADVNRKGGENQMANSHTLSREKTYTPDTDHLTRKLSDSEPQRSQPFVEFAQSQINNGSSIHHKIMSWTFADKNRLVASASVGFITSTIFLRPIYRYARKQDPALLLTITITASSVMAIIMSAVKAPIYVLILGEEWFREQFLQFGTSNFLWLLLPGLPVNIFLILTWAGFYFGINYYLTMRDQTQRALLSARLADQAQLKMLRYQLNPHFLFNTLNAISTLVLSKQNAHANVMLTQLSSFLRYSLDSDPLQTTSLADEIKASQLYLEIEKTRFTDRLKITFDVDEDVMNSKVPSLILQPAIENAIKYAIGVMEKGGEIRIVAQRENNNLFLRVCDNGPNAPENPDDLFKTKSSGGVGVVNMKERLVHLYGDNQSFQLTKLEPEGLCVSMTFPYEEMES